MIFFASHLFLVSLLKDLRQVALNLLVYLACLGKLLIVEVVIITECPAGLTSFCISLKYSEQGEVVASLVHNFGSLLHYFVLVVLRFQRHAGRVEDVLDREHRNNGCYFIANRVESR